ncbi:TetR/AcrR family transcriptional regulator [Pyrococcus abyssi]|uniref:Transcriptional regulator n=1 Tax=Pyrococcus abyssi (strain GE5 / Orsay) TaxID=272844 RepID=Q9UYP3_PYRAB|nr:TetR/AcrR family transcriptional regulator [Pyrococcus abyssi]CAB50369.1 Putative transcriptional regulator [Pyrococcus abyssi GE5]CCE70913.1 TPA: hypothetical protein PAB0976 [Pyrococcus abyssi GE5]
MDTRDKLVKAAKRLFAEKGFYRTTVDDIVKAAGVAKGTFYLYFSSKEEIIKEVAMMAMPYMAFSKVINEGIVTARYKNLEEFLYALGKSFFEYYSDPDLRTLFFHVVSIKEAIPSLKEVHNELCSRLISIGTKKILSFIGGDERLAEVAFRTFLGSLLHYLYSAECSVISQEEYLKDLVMLMCEGLRKGEHQGDLNFLKG